MFAAFLSGSSAAGVSRRLGSPLFAASFGQSEEYPSPENTTRLCALTRRWRSFCRFSLKSPFIASSLSHIASTDSATIVLSAIWLCAQFCEEPGARNSNLFPVKAKGEVRLRSVVSFGSAGSVSTPTRSLRPRSPPFIPRVPDSMESRTALSSSPRKMEMIAGGASFAPRRWSFPAPAVVMRRMSACLSIARMTESSIVRKIAFSRGLSPGVSRLRPP